MTTSRILSLLALAPVVLSLATVGCASADGDEEATVDAQDVVGVEDLTAMEKELGLKKDAKGADGKYSRSDESLKAGGCYKRTVGKSADDHEFRRYTDGIAVFRKMGTGQQSGESRPVLCLDIDKKGATSGSYDIGRAELDLIQRFHLGRETGTADNFETNLVTFERGSLNVSKGLAPAGSTNSLDTPMFRKKSVVSVLLGKGAAEQEIHAATVQLAFRYAWNKALAADDFKLASDPVGKFLSAEVEDNAPGNEHHHYELIDAHRVTVIEAGKTMEELIITPKLGAHGKITDKQLVTCKREVGKDFGEPLGSYKCVGLGSDGPIDLAAADAKIPDNCATCTIVPLKSIRGISIGEKVSDVVKTLGKPDMIETTTNIYGGFVTVYHYGLTEIGLDLKYGVETIKTSSPKVKTSKGMGVGSTEAQLKANIAKVSCDHYDDGDYCKVDASSQEPGGNGDVFIMKGPKVESYELFTVEG